MTEQYTSEDNNNNNNKVKNILRFILFTEKQQTPMVNYE